MALIKFYLWAAAKYNLNFLKIHGFKNMQHLRFYAVEYAARSENQILIQP